MGIFYKNFHSVCSYKNGRPLHIAHIDYIIKYKGCEPIWWADYLGAAKTSAYYAVAPFIGVLLSFVIFREIPGLLFFIALVIMIAGTWMVNLDPAEP